MEGVPDAFQQRALVVEHLPGAADERLLVAAHFLRPRRAGLVEGLRPRRAGLVEGLPELVGHGAQVAGRGAQQIGQGRDLLHPVGEAVDAPLQTGRRFHHGLRLFPVDLRQVRHALVETRERLGEAADGFPERLPELFPDRVRELPGGRVLVAAELERPPEVVERRLEPPVRQVEQPQRHRQVVRHAAQTCPQRGSDRGNQPPECSSRRLVVAGGDGKPNRERRHGAADPDDQSRRRPDPQSVDTAFVDTVRLVHVAHPVGAVATVRAADDVVLELLPQAVQRLRIVSARQKAAATQDAELRQEHDDEDGVQEERHRPGKRRRAGVSSR